MAEYDYKPKAIEPVGDGSYFYRWNIEQIEKQEIPSQTPVIAYRCECVIVWGPLSSDEITRCVINEIWGNGIEQKLINEYNAYILGIGKVQYKDNYFNFLTERELIKEQIDIDYNEWLNTR